MNAAIDPALCRDSISRLLADEAQWLALLEQQLTREHTLISDDDVDGLQEAGTARQSCVSKLVRIEDERLSICRQLGQSADVAGLQAILGWCDPQGSLQPALQNTTQLATRCREQNTRNGMLVSARLQRISGVVSLLNSSADTPRNAVYGRSGGNKAYATTAGRMLSYSA